MNWLDGFIALSVLIYIVNGVKRGFLKGLVELVGIIVFLSIPLILHIPAGRVLEKFGVSGVYSAALAFLIILVITISIYHTLGERLYRWIPEKIKISQANRILGLFTGLIKGIVFATLLLAIIVALPISLITSKHIEESEFASSMLDSAATVTSAAADIFGEPFHHAVGFFTIQTEEDEGVDLRFSVENPQIDEQAEVEMLRLLNEERVKEGLPELIMDETLREVARKHSIDMFRRGYFSHIDPEGVSPFDRIREGGISFIAAGENLALAQTVSIAHKGLMNSPGHRANILHTQFGKVGIGAVSGGRYGIMFTQNFTD